MSTTSSVLAASIYLTQPLIRVSYDRITLAVLTQALKTLLQASADAQPAGTLFLPFSPSRRPATSILEAARIAGINWVEWMAVLVPRQFILVVTKRAVSVEYVGLNPGSEMVWVDEAAALSPVPMYTAHRVMSASQDVPISQLSHRLKLRATIASARARAQLRAPPAPIMIPTISITPPVPSALADKSFIEAAANADGDEMFARLGRAQNGLFSPSPTRASFSLSPSQFLSPPEPQAFVPERFAAPLFGRPAAFAAFPSPLSAPSLPCTMSAMETSDADTSTTSSRPSSPTSSIDSDGAASASSATSFASVDKVASWRSASPFVPPARAPVQVIVDSSKKEVQKYLYQGGVSTVLTGGVMLGAKAKTPTTIPKKADVPLYRAPRGTTSSTTSCWRRAAPSPRA